MEFSCVIGQELELQLLDEDDVEELFDLTCQNLQHLGCWLPWVDNMKSVAGIHRYIRACQQQFADNNGFQAGIWSKGELAGIIGYHAVDWINRSTTLGYWVGESFQGQGLVTRSCYALVNYAFREWRLNRVEIRCATENRRSRAVPERLGFTEEGVIRQAEWLHDHFVDLVIYGMVAREWYKISLRLKKEQFGCELTEG